MTNQKTEPKNKVSTELETVVIETSFSLQRISVLFDSTYERFFSEDPEDAEVNIPPELLRRQYEAIQLSLQGIRELFGSAMACAKTAADLIEE